MTKKQPPLPQSEHPMKAGSSLSSLPQRKGPAPVHLWNPSYCGKIDIRIARNGTWFHEGTPIGRSSLVRLFSSILKKEGNRFFLITPVEKMEITVEDAPLFAIDFSCEHIDGQQVLIFYTTTEDIITAGPEHPLRMAHNSHTNEPSPYIMVRNGLEARIDRKSFYRLVEIGEHQLVGDTSWFGVSSQGAFFPLIQTDKL